MGGIHKTRRSPQITPALQFCPSVPSPPSSGTPNPKLQHRPTTSPVGPHSFPICPRGTPHSSGIPHTFPVLPANTPTVPLANRTLGNPSQHHIASPVGPQMCPQPPQGLNESMFLTTRVRVATQLLSAVQQRQSCCSQLSCSFTLTLLSWRPQESMDCPTGALCRFSALSVCPPHLCGCHSVPSRSVLIPEGMTEESTENRVWYPNCMVTAGWTCWGSQVTSHVEHAIEATCSVLGNPRRTPLKAT